MFDSWEAIKAMICIEFNQDDTLDWWYNALTKFQFLGHILRLSYKRVVEEEEEEEEEEKVWRE